MKNKKWKMWEKKTRKRGEEKWRTWQEDREDTMFEKGEKTKLNVFENFYYPYK